MSRYLISEYGSTEILVSTENAVYYYVESDADIRKAIESWASQSDYVIDWDSLDIDYPSLEIRFMYDLECLFDGLEYDHYADWTLIEITKP